ncbi:MAG: DUF4277 domain-containing protein [Firmicutes bacterium]|nr:DUF4277 domain-containing protein [Bacillota bacterium]
MIARILPKEKGAGTAHRLLIKKIPRIAPTSRSVGAAPLFRPLAEEIGRVSLVNTLVTWDLSPCRVSPGERIWLLMRELFAGKTPLYRVAERLTLTDVAMLIGQGRRPDDFTDDSLGRALDKLARAGPAKVFSAWALAAYAQEPRRALPSRRGLMIRPPGRSPGSLPTPTRSPCIRPMGTRRIIGPTSNNS